MAEESKKDVGESPTSTDTEVKTSKKKGILSRMWNALFRLRGDDFEKRLQHISKEEVVVLARIRRRSQRWRWMARNLIIFSILLELSGSNQGEIVVSFKNEDVRFSKHEQKKILKLVAVGYSIMTTRSLDLNWKMRALRVLPMFLLPALSFISYSAVGSFTRMCDRKDHKTLEKLRAERQAKIDELKEKTNYYTTQQLIQRYDPDPAAKAAAASILASKLGADSGLKVYVGEENKMDAPAGKSNDVEVARTTGLRNRKASNSKFEGTETSSGYRPEEGMLNQIEFEGDIDDISQQHQLIVEHRPQTGGISQDGGWFARIAALLVGEDPTQSYALICGNCHMHNGLARKEDFLYITYYCPHCNALNRPKQVDEGVPGGSNSPTPTSVDDTEVVQVVHSGSVVDAVSASSTPVAAAVETTLEGS